MEDFPVLGVEFKCLVCIKDANKFQTQQKYLRKFFIDFRDSSKKRLDKNA